jgi:tetratricopeptide (TPR) repeat protein
MGTKTVGRDAPCPCGSGKKYRHCCREKDRAERSAADRARSVQERQRQQATLEAYGEAQELDAASNAVVDLVQAGKLEQAEQAARALLERYPEVPDGYERLGLVHEARGERQQAAECYRKVIEMIRASPGEFAPEYEQELQQQLERLGTQS